MLLSNPKIDYSSVRRIPNVKLSGPTQETTTTTTTTTPTNTMSTSTSLQDISSHHKKKLLWNNNNIKDQRLVNYYENLLSSNTGRPLNSSQSDERIFEHPEVTIKPSELGDEIHRRLLIRTSNTTDNLIEFDAGQSVPNVLEHPDMRSPVIMQMPQLSSSLSSSSFMSQNNCKTINRAQSVDAPPITSRTTSPSIRVDACDDNNQDSSRSVSFSSSADDIGQNPDYVKNEDRRSFSFSTGVFTPDFPNTSSKLNMDSMKIEPNDSS